MLCLLWIVHAFFRCAPSWRKNREVYLFLAKPLISILIFNIKIKINSNVANISLMKGHVSVC